MPRSIFLGRVQAAGEPLWTDDDRQWALALLEYEADLCPGCGRSRTETTHPDADGGYEGTAIRCHGCAAVARMSELHSKAPHDPRGLYISVRPRGEIRR